MRRLMFSVFAFGFLIGMLSGCRSLCHTNGICDCDHDDDPCAHRAPWVRQASSGPVSHTAHKVVQR